MNGVINLFKPRGMTSHDAVRILRKILNTSKIGHIGTLDPLASGVLPLCIGKATRIVEYLGDLDKEYIAELSLGIRTDTQDVEGKVIASSDKKVDEKLIYSVMEKYKGDLSQIPPMYSALKYKGKKLYELAREGKIIERQARNIKIYDQEILDIQDGKSIVFYVRCSKGTYIRTLCDDIGKLLGTFGYMSYLIRVGVGEFKIWDSISLDYIKKANREGLEAFIYPIDECLHHLESLTVDDRYYNQLVNGAIVPIRNLVGLDNLINQPLRVYCRDSFIGVGILTNMNNAINLKMDKVLI